MDKRKEMITTKSILLFFIKTTLVFVALLLFLSQTNQDKKLLKTARTWGNYCFENLGKEARVHFDRNKNNHFDTQIQLTSQSILRTAAIKKDKRFKMYLLYFDLRKKVYLPLLFLIALIVATPIKVKRKIFALFSGLFLLVLWLLLEFYIYLLYNFERISWLPDMTEIAFLENLIKGLYFTLFDNSGLLAIVPVLIWLLVSFRKSDWQEQTIPKSLKLKI